MIVQLMIDFCFWIKWNMIGLWFWFHLIVDILYPCKSFLLEGKKWYKQMKLLEKYKLQDLINHTKYNSISNYYGALKLKTWQVLVLSLYFLKLRKSLNHMTWLYGKTESLVMISDFECQVWCEIKVRVMLQIW